ncbi:MAG: response regulator, partial [Cyanobacteria bacterium]|nr:response regulator [Cyanobacteriota bacterium]
TNQTTLAAVFMDMMMPNLDGAAAIRAIQKINPQVPIMAVSGLPSNQPAALSAGARTFLPKPYTTTELLNTLAQMLPASAPPIAE